MFSKAAHSYNDSKYTRAHALTHTTMLTQTEKFSYKYEPPHDKTNKMACAPSEDSDQPGHPPSLIFAVRLMCS